MEMVTGLLMCRMSVVNSGTKQVVVPCEACKKVTTLQGKSLGPVVYEDWEGAAFDEMAKVVHRDRWQVALGRTHCSSLYSGKNPQERCQGLLTVIEPLLEYGANHGSGHIRRQREWGVCFWEQESGVR